MSTINEETKIKGCFWMFMMLMFGFLLIVGLFMLGLNIKLYFTQEGTEAVVVGNVFEQSPDAGPIYKPVLRFRNKAGVIVSVRNASFYQHGEPYKIGKKMTIRYTILNEEEDKYYIVNENFWFTWGVPVVITLLGASMLFFLRNGDTPE